MPIHDPQLAPTVFQVIKRTSILYPVIDDLKLQAKWSEKGETLSREQCFLLLRNRIQVEEIRNTDAWVMGQDTSGAGFHETLLRMLSDPSPMVRGNAALSLVRFGDASGRAEIVRLLQPAVITAPQTGTITDTSAVGTGTHQNGVVAKLQAGGQATEIRSPIGGRIRTLSVQTGRNVVGGTEIATVAPGTDQVWEALRALYLIGQLDDLPAVMPYERELPDIPDHVRQQAKDTEQAIRDRAGKAGG